MIKNFVKEAIRRTGFNLNIYRDPIKDVKDLIAYEPSPVLFDVGANHGQTARRLNHHFPSANIFSFEPSPATYPELTKATSNLSKVRTFQMGLGDVPGTLPFNENVNSDMSSFLSLGEAGWGRIENITQVDVSTVDEFCAKNSIPKIQLLKSDTQGFDLAVLRGAQSMLSSKNIDLVYMEVNFAPLYQNTPSLKDILSWMEQFEYRLISIYEIHYLNRTLGWTDVLFGSPTMQDRMKTLK